MRKLIMTVLLLLALMGVAIFTGWRTGLLPESVMAMLPGTKPPPPQRAASDGEAKAAAQARDADAAISTPPAAEASPAQTPEEVAWIPASTPVSLFGGGVLYFCHDLEITRSHAPTEAIATALAYPAHSHWADVGLVAVADVHWPADSGDLNDLNTLANAALKQQPTLCETYGNIWDSAALADFTPTDDTYLTGIARFVEDAAAPHWVVRIGIIEED